MPDLTPQQIDALPAGREMDALVAKLVMGKTLHPDRCRVFLGRDTWMPLRRYSTDIAAALEVVDTTSAGSVRLHFAQNQWSALIDKEPWSPESRMSFGVIFASADTAPLAICRASLKWAMAKGEQGGGDG